MKVIVIMPLGVVNETPIILLLVIKVMLDYLGGLNFVSANFCLVLYIPARSFTIAATMRDGVRTGCDV